MDAERHRGRRVGLSRPGLGVVVPTLDEAGALPRLLGDLERLGRALPGPADVVVVVSDGGSSDDTRALARDAGALVLCGRAGRAAQLRRGVLALETPWLLLLHADCRLDALARGALVDFLDRAGEEDAAHFGFALDRPGLGWRLVEVGQRVRERVTGLVYGDQGLVLSRALWDRSGGVPDLPLMEDVVLVDRVRRAGHLHRLPARLPTSARRYVGEGPVRAWLRNTALVSAFRLGVPADRLAPLYPPRSSPAAPAAPPPPAPGGEAPGDRALVVFVKAPRPGGVKTRLAADVGSEAAAALYRRLGLRIVRGLLTGPWTTTVAFAPADAREEVREWLGPEPRLVVQRGGDLGRRMDAALTEALHSSGRACVVGTDAPGVDVPYVEAAFEALDHADVVLGPAEDGGYVLLGLREPAPALFEGVPWSTDGVLARTLTLARRAGLSIHLLPARPDVDRLEDVSPALRHLMEPPAP